MNRKKVRWLSWLMIFSLCVSILVLPAGAAEGDAAGAALPEEEVPLVNVIEDETPQAAVPDELTEPLAAAPYELTESQIVAPDEPGETVEAASADGSPEAEDVQPLDGDPETVTVSYYAGSTLLKQETVARGGTPSEAPAADAAGAAVVAWVDASGAVVSVSQTPVDADVSYYVWYIPSLKTAEHSRYMNGTGAARFSPAAALTRAQAAVILYTLLESRQAGPYTSAFSDIPEGTWYTDAVKTLASCGVINGYSDGTFRPTRAVTRAEFVTMLVNLTGVAGGSAAFTDVAGHWAVSSIAAAAGAGWLSGYAESDGTYTFRPQKSITRAEAVVVMNRVLGRKADKAALSGGTGILHYLDVNEAYWAYGDIMEASIGHTYEKSSGSETWTHYNVESSGLAAGLQNVGSAFCYIDGNGQPVRVDAGVSQIGGKYYYAASAGYTITADLSSKAGYAVFANRADQALADGFNRIGTTLFYWNRSTGAPQYLTAGLNQIAGKTYWADANGYAVRNTFGRGVVELGGKRYLSDGYCAIITSGEGYVSASSLPTTIDLRNQTYEFDGHMYYIQSDYSLAADTWVGYLYFGADCRYTSGDAELDAMVDNLVYNAIGVSSGGTFYPAITNTGLTKVQKLLKAYWYLRGGEGDHWVDSGYRYRNVGMIFYAERYNRQSHIPAFINCAKQMFTVKYGRCYEWAAAYLYLARRLGFQAYLVVGTVYSSDSPHCWNMIEWDGVWHISDVEIEWAHVSGIRSTSGSPYYHDLFAQALPSESVTYYVYPQNGIISYKFPY